MAKRARPPPRRRRVIPNRRNRGRAAGRPGGGRDRTVATASSSAVRSSTGVPGVGRPGVAAEARVDRPSSRSSPANEDRAKRVIERVLVDHGYRGRGLRSVTRVALDGKHVGGSDRGRSRDRRRWSSELVVTGDDPLGLTAPTTSRSQVGSSARPARRWISRRASCAPVTTPPATPTPGSSGSMAETRRGRVAGDASTSSRAASDRSTRWRSSGSKHTNPTVHRRRDHRRGGRDPAQLRSRHHRGPDGQLRAHRASRRHARCRRAPNGAKVELEVVGETALDHRGRRRLEHRKRRPGAVRDPRRQSHRPGFQPQPARPLGPDRVARFRRRLAAAAARQEAVVDLDRRISRAAMRPATRTWPRTSRSGASK